MRLFLLPPSQDGFRTDCWNELRLLIRCMVACFGLLTIWACLWVFYDECFLFVDFLNPEVNVWRDWMYLVFGILIKGALGTYCFECVVVTTPTFPPPNLQGKRKIFYAIVQYIRMVVSLFASILCWVGGYGLLEVDDEFESVTQYMVAYIIAGVTLVALSGTLYPTIEEGWPDEIDLSTCSRSQLVLSYVRATMGLCGDIMAWVGWDGLMSVDSQVEQVLHYDIIMFWTGFVVMYFTRTLPQLVEIDDIDFQPEHTKNEVLLSFPSPRDGYEPINEPPSCRSRCRRCWNTPLRLRVMYTIMSLLGYFAWLASWSGVESIYYWSGFDNPDSDKKTWWIQLACVGAGLVAMTAAHTIAPEA